MCAGARSDETRQTSVAGHLGVHRQRMQVHVAHDGNVDASVMVELHARIQHNHVVTREITMRYTVLVP